MSGWIVVAGCGDGGVVRPDAGADAGGMVCTIEDGRSYLMSEMAVVGSDQGFDLDGDADIDNSLGNLADAVREGMNAQLAGLIEDGVLLIVFHITGWTDPPTPTDTSIELALFHSTDADEPRDPNDNFSGDEDVLAFEHQFDLACEPLFQADTVAIEDRLLRATATRWDLVLTTLTGSAAFTGAQLALTFDEDFGAFSGLVGATLPVCSLSNIPAPGSSGSMLDVLVNEPVLAGTAVLDMDLDGDGLEQLVGDGVSILHCIDGDGSIVAGSDCICHPRIADGYSVAFRITAVTCHIAGVHPTTENARQPGLPPAG